VTRPGAPPPLGPFEQGGLEAADGDPATATTSASVARASLWTIASRVVPQFNILAISIAAARFLGPEDFGRQSFIAFVVVSATLLFNAGFGNALSRYMSETLGARRPEGARDLVSFGWQVELACAVLAGGALAAAGALGADPPAAWLLAGVVVAIGVMHAVPSSVLAALQLWRQAAIVGLVSGTVAVPATIAVLAAGGGITGMFAVEAVIAGANLVWTGALASKGLARIGTGGGGPTAGLRGTTARFAAVSTFNILLELVVFRRSEFAFLDAFSTDVEIGLYSIAFAAVTALSKAPEAVAAVIVPAFATLLGAGAWHRIRSGFGRAVRLVPLTTLPLTALGLALGGPLIELVYGSEYEGVEPVLVVMLLFFPALPVAILANATLVALARQRAIVIALSSAAVVNVVLNLLLVPRYDAVGAALANGVAQLVAATPVFVQASRLLSPVEWAPRALVANAVAAGGMGGAAFAVVSWLGGVAGVVTGAVAGGVVFTILGWALRLLTRDDARWLEELAGRRLGGTVGLAARVFSRA
jgi:O-antigen/teichoic acid export membrane protein